MTAPVVVVGDVMIDVFESGTVERVSPEAPVLVVLNPSARSLLGGAANTAANVARLGSPAGILGVVGEDQSGDAVRALIEAAGLTDLLVRTREAVTTVKTRISAGGHQIVRIDHERALPTEAEALTVARVHESVGRADAFVLSDYDKGVVTEVVARAVIERGRLAGSPVVVDSKKTVVDLFAGCAVIAPNHLEAARMTGTTDPSEAARRIAARTSSAVLVTLGADGMLLLDGDTETRIPSHAREVSDVTGAGDTVTAALAVALARGERMVDAARWANMAAAVSVAHHGTYAVSSSEVEEYHRVVATSDPS